MCLIVNSNDRLVSADEDITVYKIFVRSLDGERLYTPYRNRTVGKCDVGAELSDEFRAHIQRSQHGDHDEIDGGVLHAFTDLNENFYSACRSIGSDALDPSKVEVHRMIIPKGSMHILSRDGNEAGARRLIFDGKVDNLREVMVKLSFRFAPSFK